MYQTMTDDTCRKGANYETRDKSSDVWYIQNGI